MFYTRIPNPPPGLNIVGMSGCPIFGFIREAGGGASYYFVAIQSAWLRESKIIRACRMPFLGRLLRTAINGLMAGEDATP